MLENSHSRTLLTVLEDYLVQEFRLMQNLIEITKKERTYFPTGKADELMSVVESKEAVLDQLTLLEEKRKTVIQELGRELGMQLKSSSLSEILPWIDSSTAGRLNRLSEGISMLVGQARDLNYGNRAMATTALEWVESTKAFIFGFYQKQFSYSPPGSMNPSMEQAPAWAVERKA
jgi:flagellar biosynthesis/type III secretory pathway chaperone